MIAFHLRYLVGGCYMTASLKLYIMTYSGIKLPSGVKKAAVFAAAFDVWLFSFHTFIGFTFLFYQFKGIEKGSGCGIGFKG